MFYIMCCDQVVSPHPGHPHHPLIILPFNIFTLFSFNLYFSHSLFSPLLQLLHTFWYYLFYFLFLSSHSQLSSSQHNQLIHPTFSTFILSKHPLRSFPSFLHLPIPACLHHTSVGRQGPSPIKCFEGMKNPWK